MTIIRKLGVSLAWLAAVLLSVATTAQAVPQGTVTYFINDLLGSPAVAMDQSGTVIWRESYSGYGERKNQPADTAQSPRAANKVWYTSRHQDEDTGLVYMGARYYDPALGRFLSVDPVGFNEGNVHSFNRYAYANNNPYRFKDPDGRNAVTAVGGLLTESFNVVTGQGFNGSMVLGALKDGYNGEGAGVLRSAGEDALSFAGGALGAAVKGARAAAATVAAEKLAVDANKLNHIFGKTGHNLDEVVSAAGSREAAFGAMEKGAQSAFDAGKLATDSHGVYKTVVNVGGADVTVKGAVVDGVVRVGSAWR